MEAGTTAAARRVALAEEGSAAADVAVAAVVAALGEAEAQVRRQGDEARMARETAAAAAAAAEARHSIGQATMAAALRAAERLKRTVEERAPC